MIKSSVRTLYFTLGVLSFVAGAIGVLLPLVPTTPFLLLAAFFFSRSSPRLHRYLMDHPRFGKSLREWQEYRVIRPRAKALAVGLICISFVYLIFDRLDVLWQQTLMAVIGVVICLFILTRRSAPPTTKGAPPAQSRPTFDHHQK